MSDQNPVRASASEEYVESSSSQQATVDADTLRVSRGERVRWWIKLIAQPLLFLAMAVGLIVALGVAQQHGWLTTSNGTTKAQGGDSDSGARFICPMMCTPPQTEPGRCPVCEMELVKAAGATSSGSNWLELSPAARRVANIQTVTVRAVPVTRKIRAVGELAYDEGGLKTIAAYVSGRLERLYADYTGVKVARGEKLAELYSPRLYSAQVEFLLAKKAHRESSTSTLKAIRDANLDLYRNARRLLFELGMTKAQTADLEKRGRAISRIKLLAPISGTVIERLAVEGQYVKEGQAIYRLADLSKVWLMLRLFPEDAATIRYGQKVTTTINSLPGRTFSGRVAFKDLHVDAKTRTVGVRVVIDNSAGLLRIGDYANATVSVPLTTDGNLAEQVYDPELANKWISPRHPHVIESRPGKCRVCGVPLVPAREYGFTSEPQNQQQVLLVPRNAVLMAGNASVVYVETKPGRFELRKVTVGPASGDDLVIRKGVKDGEQVALSGNFLIDSQMQLAGNPSLIDPEKLTTPSVIEDSPEIIANLQKLSAKDFALARQQRICPVTELVLGKHGVPVKMTVNGRPVFVCCKPCGSSLLAEPKKYLARLRRQKVEAHEGLPPMGDFELSSDSDMRAATSETNGLPAIGDLEPLEKTVDPKVADRPKIGRDKK